MFFKCKLCEDCKFKNDHELFIEAGQIIHKNNSKIKGNYVQEILEFKPLKI